MKRYYFGLALYAFGIAFIGFYLPFLFQVALYTLAFWVWITCHGKEAATGPETVTPWLIPIVLLYIAVTRIYPFLLGHPAPLGYDTGIYLYEFERAFQQLPDFQMGIHPGLFFFADMLHLLGLDAGWMMREGYILFSLLVPLALYAVVKDIWGRNAAIISLVLFAISGVQFHAYTFILYKNVLGLSLLLFCLLLLHRRSWLLMPCALFLALLQPTHFVILGFTLLLFWILRWKHASDWRFAGAHMIVVTLLALVVFLKNPQLIVSALEVAQKKDPISDGIFLDTAGAMKMMFFYIPFALFALFRGSDTHKVLPFVLALGATAAMVFFRTFFFRRYLIELDVFFIFFASGGVAILLSRIVGDRLMKNIVILFVVSFVMVQSFMVITYKPLISAEEWHRVSLFCIDTEPDAVVMATHNLYSPWLRGFSCRRVYAPGLFELNKWDEPTWRTFWHGTREQREQLMESTFTSHQTVYLYVGENQNSMGFDDHQNFTRINDHVWKWQKPISFSQ